MKNMKKSLLPLAGATLMLGSVIAITEAAVSKKKSRGASAVQTLAGIAGLVSGVVLALQPAKARYEAGTTVQSLVSEEDEQVLRKHINEILGEHVERGTAPAQMQQIEVDDDTTIDDFIFGN